MSFRCSLSLRTLLPARFRRSCVGVMGIAVRRGAQRSGFRFRSPLMDTRSGALQRPPLIFETTFQQRAAERDEGARLSEEQIIGRLRESEAGVGRNELCRPHGIREQTFYRWNARVGRMDAGDAMKPWSPENENRRLKPVVADLTLWRSPPPFETPQVRCDVTASVRLCLRLAT